MAKDTKQQPKAATFEPAELIAGAAEHFGERPELMAGALYGVTGAITKDDARKRLADFKKKGVR